MSEQYTIDDFEIPKPVEVEKQRYQSFNVEASTKPKNQTIRGEVNFVDTMRKVNIKYPYGYWRKHGRTGRPDTQQGPNNRSVVGASVNSKHTHSISG